MVEAEASIVMVDAGFAAVLAVDWIRPKVAGKAAAALEATQTADVAGFAEMVGRPSHSA
jgi:hypothetical protein